MKSKKIVALALTAAMAISMASMTAFAADVAPGDDQTYVVTATKADSAGVKFSAIKDQLKPLDNTMTKEFVGWALTKGATTALTDKSDVIKASTAAGTSVVLYPVWKPLSDEQIDANYKAQAEAESKADKSETREDYLKKADAEHNADGKNGYNGQGDVRVETTAVSKQKAQDVIDDFAYHACKVANVDHNSSMVWVFDVNKINGDLYPGNNARVTLDLTKANVKGESVNYDLNKFSVKVYHIKDWCKSYSVKGLDISNDTKDVTFWTNDFSPYVVVLSPKEATTSEGKSTNNPGTGDFSAVPVALLAAAALGATGFVAYRKRKAE